MVQYKELLTSASKSIGDGDYKQAIPTLKECIILLDHEGVSPEIQRARAEVYSMLVESCERTGNWVDGLVYANVASGIYKQIGDRMKQCKMLIAAGNMLLKKSSLDSALLRFSEALKAAGQHTVLEGQIRRQIGVAHWRLGQHGKAMSEARSSIQCAKESGDMVGMAKGHMLLSAVAFDTGKYAEAINEVIFGIEILEKSDDHVELARAYNNLAEIYKALKDYEKSLSTLEIALSTARKSNNQRGVGYVLFNMAECYVKLGQIDAAKEALAEAERLLSKSPERYHKGCMLLVKGLIHAAENESEKSLEKYLAAVDTFAVIGIPYDEGIARLELGHMARKFGMNDLARAQYTWALRLFNKVGALALAKTAQAAIRSVEMGLGTKLLDWQPQGFAVLFCKFDCANVILGGVLP